MPSYVLVADPDASFAEMARREAQRAGLEAVVVRDGSAAHDLLASRGAPVALICELALPRRDGFALLRGLRRVDGKREVPAIVASSFPAMRVSAESLRKELGPMVVLAKPAGESVLRGALASALQGKSAAAPKPAPTSAPQAAEEKRLARLAATGLVDDKPPPDDLQKLVASVARSFGVPIALMSLVLRDTQWFKAHHGIDGSLLANRGSPRDWSFCSHVVDGHRPLVVPDARHHPVFADNPLVQEGTVIGYAGVPLETADGQVLGSLCIIDRRPLDIASGEIERLTMLARRVAGEIALREAERILATASDRARAAAPARGPIAIPPVVSPLAYIEAAMAVIETGVIVFDEQRRVSFANPAACAMFGVTGDALAGKSRDEALRIVASKLARHEEIEKLRVPDEGP